MNILHLIDKFMLIVQEHKMICIFLPLIPHLTLYKAVACILPLKGTVTETGGGSYIATIDK